VKELQSRCLRLPASRSIPTHAIGLLGGSFQSTPCRASRISLFAIKRLKLERVWVLVTPGNPPKDQGGLARSHERGEAARKMANDPRIDVSCLESVIGNQIYRRNNQLFAPPRFRPAASSGSWR